MKPGLFRDALLVVAPCAAVVAGLASVDHHQRLVEAGYRVARLEKERDDLSLEVEHRRVRVANLSSPVRLLGEARARKLPVDYPIAWNRVTGDEEAAGLLARRAAPMTALKSPPMPRAGAARETKGTRAVPRSAPQAPDTGKKRPDARRGTK